MYLCVPQTGVQSTLSVLILGRSAYPQQKTLKIYARRANLVALQPLK